MNSRQFFLISQRTPLPHSPNVTVRATEMRERRKKKYKDVKKKNMYTSTATSPLQAYQPVILAHIPAGMSLNVLKHFQQFHTSREYS